MEEQSTKLGFLMEAAASHQNLAENVLRQLAAHTQDLEAVVRGEIRRALGEELQALSSETTNAIEGLRAVRRSVTLRVRAWNLAIVVLSGVAFLGVGWVMLPSRTEIARLRERRDELSSVVAQLARQGGQAELRRCGESQRLCVRIDRNAPAYGASADYYVVKGY
jgi:hypothetical protein